MDFESLIDELDSTAIIEPRELYEQLPYKAAGYGYLRDVQAQVLTEWHKVRTQRDIALKVNTGGGKTIDGLVILQSYLNEGIVPALYVAPTRYLRDQVRAEAARLGIPTVENPDDSAYAAGEAIAVVTAAKLFNGGSVFSNERSSPYVRIGAVVIDDAHAVMSTAREKLAMTIRSSNATFDAIFQLFKSDLKSQSADAVLDIEENTGSALVRVPFWSVRERLDALRTILRAHKPEDALDTSWKAIRNVLEFCRITFTLEAITIAPIVPFVRRITGFAEARRRVYLTATLANDSTLVTDFDANPAEVTQLVQPLTAGDIGERMILAPEELNPAIGADDVRKSVAALAVGRNALIIVPSDAAMSRWADLGARPATAAELPAVVANMRANSNLGMVVVANKYDGIDLPNDACRILVLDGLPQAFSADERIESQMLRSVGGIDDRQVQRLEQGMGRAVRSNEDHCVVFLIGRQLAQLTSDPRTLDRFGPATQAQLRASRLMAKNLKSSSLKKIIGVAGQALDREEGWVKYAKKSLRSLPPAPAQLDPIAVASRHAFNSAELGDPSRAADILRIAIESESDPRRAGWLMEQQALYIDRVNPAAAQDVLAIARTKNDYVTRPLSGVVFRPLISEGTQANVLAGRLSSMFPTKTQMLIAVHGILDQLRFKPGTAEDFEDALLQLGLFLGLGSQRPEREMNDGGPDNLWAFDDSTFWVIEAKNGVTTDFIAKKDAGQLGQSMGWFGRHYPAGQAATPVMIHPSRKLHKQASEVSGMRIINERGLGELAASAQGLAEGLMTIEWNDSNLIQTLLVGHKLDAKGLKSRLLGAMST